MNWNKSWEEIEEAYKKDIERINKYWDAKTLFVHRRALILGTLCGFGLGVSFMAFVFTVLLWTKIAP